jgi:hypothetical protein
LQSAIGKPEQFGRLSFGQQRVWIDRYRALSHHGLLERAMEALSHRF